MALVREWPPIVRASATSFETVEGEKGDKKHCYYKVAKTLFDEMWKVDLKDYVGPLNETSDDENNAGEEEDLEVKAERKRKMDAEIKAWEEERATAA